MARRRLFEYGPSVRTPRLGMQPVSVVSENSRRGVFLRNPPGVVIGHSTTVKSRMGQATRKGIEPPGYQAPNYVRPLS